jgi:tripartite-type tricarboxylate transporter receptor subunit TctC
VEVIAKSLATRLKLGRMHRTQKSAWSSSGDRSVTLKHSLNRRKVLTALGGAAMLPLARQARAQTFPTKPIKVLIGVPAGGTQDVLTRSIANHLRDSLGIIVIEHKSGANGNIAMETVKAAEPDGHTLILGTASMLAMNPHTYKEVRFDSLKDYEPIVLGARFELAMNVHPDVPANTLAELIAWAKANPAKASFASYGAGTPSHFLGEMLNEAAGLKMTHVPYRGSPVARQDILGGQIPIFFDVVGGSISHFRAGRVKVLATSGTGRSPFLPDVPTFVELGFPKVNATAWFSYLAPAKTPKAVVDRLNSEFNRAINSREVRQQLLGAGMYPVGGTRAELTQKIRDDSAQWARVIKSTGFVAS